MPKTTASDLFRAFSPDGVFELAITADSGPDGLAGVFLVPAVHYGRRHFAELSHGGRQHA